MHQHSKKLTTKADELQKTWQDGETIDGGDDGV
jgi:hypothetical protein